MTGHAEELALERHAVQVLEEEAARYFRGGHYMLWTDARREAEKARERVRELEQLGER